MTFNDSATDAVLRLVRAGPLTAAGVAKALPPAAGGDNRDVAHGALRTLHRNGLVRKWKNGIVVLWSATPAGRRAA